MDEIEPAVSSPLSKERRTTMSKLVEHMTPLCCIYDVDLINLSEEDELGVGKNLRGKLDFFWPTICKTFE